MMRVIAIETCSRTLLPVDIPANMIVLVERVTCQMNGWTCGFSSREEKLSVSLDGPSAFVGNNGRGE